jgi:hypothetical protein
MSDDSGGCDCSHFPRRLCYFILATLCTASTITYMHFEVVPELQRSNILSRHRLNCNRTYGQAASQNWKSSLVAQRNAQLTSIYARLLAYSSMEWLKKDYMSYTPRAMEWDRCMTGQEYCVISFAMYASDTKALAYYIRCLLRAQDHAAIYFPGWRVRVYHDSAIPKSELDVARSRGVETISMPKSDMPGKIAGMFWRFYVADDSSVDRYMIRDLDSIFSWRERTAVDEWILSNRSFHVLRDHVIHDVPIMGGMWGGVKGAFSFVIQETCQEYVELAGRKGGDQEFLWTKVWPEVVKAGWGLLLQCSPSSAHPCSVSGTLLIVPLTIATTLIDAPSRLVFKIRMNLSGALSANLQHQTFLELTNLQTPRKSPLSAH